MAIVKKKPSKTLTPAQLLAKVQMDHRAAVRSMMRGCGFHRVTGVSDKEFIFDGQKSDFDDIFVYENVVLLTEYTASQPSDVGGHLKKKKIIYDKIDSDPSGFINLLREKFPESAQQFPVKYHDTKLIVKLLYCSRYSFDAHYKDTIPNPVFLDYPALRYFGSVIDAIKKSALLEVIGFLGIDPKRVGNSGKISVATGGKFYPGSLLPEAHSHFDNGYKIVSFYADPDALLKTSYVLRKDGWRDSLNLYQRMISKAKVEAIRAYLKTERRVFINNIIVTLPPDVSPVSNDGKTIDAKGLNDTAPVLIQLPDRPNSVGLIDGQHRVFAYYESPNDDMEIAELRVQQNLLVTGIIYPPGVAEPDRQKFEAKLFLEINSTQTSANSPLKQAIGVVLDPYSNESIAARVLSGMAKEGPLAGFIQQHFYETEMLKTASIVSYGLKPLVKASGSDSIYSMWNNPLKESISNQSDLMALESYLEFCVKTINMFLRSVKRNLEKSRWTTASKVPGRVLSTTYINSFLITLRLLIERSEDLEEERVRTKLSDLNSFDFSIYHSSQYARMAEKIVDTYFPKSTLPAGASGAT